MVFAELLLSLFVNFKDLVERVQKRSETLSMRYHYGINHNPLAGGRLAEMAEEAKRSQELLVCELILTNQQKHFDDQMVWKDTGPDKS